MWMVFMTLNGRATLLTLCSASNVRTALGSARSASGAVCGRPHDRRPAREELAEGRANDLDGGLGGADLARTERLTSDRDAGPGSRPHDGARERPGAAKVRRQRDGEEHGDGGPRRDERADLRGRHGSPEVEGAIATSEHESLGEAQSDRMCLPLGDAEHDERAPGSEEAGRGVELLEQP